VFLARSTKAVCAPGWTVRPTRHDDAERHASTGLAVEAAPARKLAGRTHLDHGYDRQADEALAG
jgi:hypothetical protein